MKSCQTLLRCSLFHIRSASTLLGTVLLAFVLGTSAIASAQGPDLTVSIEDTPDPVNQGFFVTYTVTVENIGSATASNVVLTFELPPEMAFESTTNGSESGGIVTSNLGNLASTASVNVDIVARALKRGPSFTSSASVTSDSAESNTDNNSDTESTFVNQQRTDLTLAKTASASEVSIGDLITYTLTLNRLGPNRAKDTELVDDLPSGVDFVSATTTQGTCSESGGKVTCVIGDILHTEPIVTVTIVVRAAQIGAITNSAEATHFTEDPDTENNKSSVTTKVVACDLSVNPTSHDFGEVDEQSTAQQTTTLTNNGNAACIGTASITGDSKFSIISGGNYNIPAGGKHNVVVRFDCRGQKPATANGTLKLSSNDPGGDVNVPLSGECITTAVPDINSDPLEVRFGKLKVGLQSDEKVFTFKNEGTLDLTITKAQRAGSHGFDFELVNLTLPLTLRPGRTQEVKVRFVPKSVGKRTGRIKVESNDPDENPFIVKFKGEGLPAPDIALDKSSANFGDGEVGGGVDVIITVTNEGTADLDVSGTDLTGSDPSQWNVKNGAPFTLAPGTSRQVRVTFAPTSEGAKSATLRFTSNDPDEDPVDVSLSGTGVITEAPDITVDPGVVDFGEVEFGMAPKDTVLIINEGNLNLLVSSTSITGAASSEFQVTAGGAPFTLAPRDTGKVIVCFKPASNGAKTATLEIQSNDPNENPVEVSLSGTGFGAPEPDIAVVDTLDFGEVGIDTSSKLILLVINEGEAVLDVSGINFGGQDAGQFSVTAGGPPFTVAPKDTAEMTVCFQPETNRAKTATLQIVSNDPDESTVEVLLSGEGTGGIPDIGADTNALGFGENEVGEAPKLTVVISNEGTADLEVSSTNIAGANAGEFTVTAGGTPFVLAPGQTHDLTVCFRPASEGLKNATLSIASNDPDESPLDITLTGTGTVTALVEKTVIFGDRSDADFAGTTSDSYIDAKPNKQNFNMGASKFLRVGNDGAANTRPNRALMRFDFIPGLTQCGVTDARQIIDAQLELVIFSSEGSDNSGLTIDAIRVNRDWTEGTSSYDSAAAGEVTWTAAKLGQDTWTTPGVAAISSDREATADDSKFVNSTGPVTWNVTTSVRAIFASGQNHGWLLQSQNEGVNQYFRIYSSEHRKQLFRPKLTIIANVPPGGSAQTAETGPGDVEENTVVGLQTTNGSGHTLPQAFVLRQNYPNPFNPETEIGFELAAPAIVTLTVFDITGREVRRLVNLESRQAGSFTVVWDGRDDAGQSGSSGSYFYRILVQPLDGSTQPFIQTRKMVFLK